MSYITYAAAFAEGYARAQAEGVALWEDISALIQPAATLRLKVSFRDLAQPDSVSARPHSDR